MRGGDEASEHSQRRRLAATTRSQQGNEFSGFDGQIEIAHGDVALAVDFPDAFELENRNGLLRSGRLWESSLTSPVW